MRAGLGMVVGKFGQILAKVGIGWQVWIGQTDRAGMGDMGVGVGVGVGIRAGLGVVVGGCGQVLADMGKDGQRRACLDGSDWSGGDG